MSRCTVEKTTLGAIAPLGLMTPDGDQVPVVDALRECWVIWPSNLDDEPSVYLNEGDALHCRDHLEAREDEGE